MIYSRTITLVTGGQLHKMKMGTERQYTLSAELGRIQARKHMDKLVQEWGNVDKETYSTWRTNELSKLIEGNEND